MLVSAVSSVNLSVEVYLDGEQPAVDDFSDLIYPDVSSRLRQSSSVRGLVGSSLR